jgi:hypothetical protein
MKMLGRIKVGALISQDHGVGRWPSQKNGEPIDPDKVFEMKWLGSFWECRADGYGFHAPRGDYGNGSIFVHEKDGIVLEAHNAK